MLLAGGAPMAERGEPDDSVEYTCSIKLPSHKPK